MDDVSQTQKAEFKICEDLYGVSVAQLNVRLERLHEEIARVEVELAKKEKDISATHNLFSSAS